jgi:site-specific recombinase XerD
MKRSTELGTPNVFPSRANAENPIRSVKKAHRSAATRANFKGHFRRCDLRHSFATQAVASVADLPTFSSLLGHASILMTMRYVHPAAEQKRGVIEKFEALSLPITGDLAGHNFRIRRFSGAIQNRCVWHARSVHLRPEK